MERFALLQIDQTVENVGSKGPKTRSRYDRAKVMQILDVNINVPGA
jgi:hypothetical protein